MIQKVVDNYVLMSVSILFINKIITDFRSNRRHLFRLSSGMKPWEYYLGNMLIEFMLYILLITPTFITLTNQLNTVKAHKTLIVLDILTKLSFGLFLFPALYLTGFLLRFHETVSN